MSPGAMTLTGFSCAVATAVTLTLENPMTYARKVLIGPLAALSRLVITRTALGSTVVGVNVLVAPLQFPVAMSPAFTVTVTPAAWLSAPAMDAALTMRSEERRVGKE